MAGKHHGGAWKVAYADFVTAMMAFFLVMWITGQNAEVKGSIARYFKHPFSFPSEFPGSSSILPFKGAAGDNGMGEGTGGDRDEGRGRGRGRGTHPVSARYDR